MMVMEFETQVLVSQKIFEFGALLFAKQAWAEVYLYNMASGLSLHSKMLVHLLNISQKELS